MRQIEQEAAPAAEVVRRDKKTWEVGACLRLKKAGCMWTEKRTQTGFSVDKIWIIS